MTSPGRRRADVGIEHELAQLQWRDVRKQFHVRLHAFQRFVDAAESRHRLELRLEQRFVGRFDFFAEDVFDDFVTLIHRLLDQRITAERADDVQAFHVRFVLRTDRRNRIRILVRKLHAARFDESARCGGAESRDDSVEKNLRFAVRRVQNHSAFFTANRKRIDALGTRVVIALDRAVLDRFQDRRFVAFLGAREFVFAIDDDDVVLFRQRDRVLDRRIARADHRDDFAFVFVRIVELVLHERQVFTRASELADVALQADAHHHEFRFDRLPVRAGQHEAAARLLDRADFVLVLRVDLQPRGAFVPGVENRFARSGLERNRRAQRQNARLVHHELAFLVPIDRVGQMIFGFEQHVRNAALGRARRSGQAAGARSDDSYLETFRHDSPPGVQIITG